MTSSVAPYEQLVRQVEALKAENSHLRQELRDNSSHLSKLETETSGMKEVLKRLQGKLEQEARVLVSSGQTEVLEQLKALQMDITSLYNLKFQPPALGPEPAAQTPEGSPVHGSGPSKDSFGELSRATIRLLEELDRERCFLLNEIEKEEKEKLWYYSQLQGLSKRLDELPHVETQFSMQMDLIRQQLEFEAQHIRSLMEERFGTSDEMVQRAQIRASRLEQIDKELLSAQDRVQQTEPQALLAVKSMPLDEDTETEVPTHPEDGAPQPGNSKVEVVFWLLSMLATRDQEDTARTLLAMSSSPESCVAMRRSGCLPLLLQILHGTEAGAGGRNGNPGAPGAKDARMRANAALHNIVFSQPDQGLARKEMRVLHVLEQIRAYCETCWDWLQARDGGPEGGGAGGAPVPIEPQICQATCAVMKLSFDEEYRRAMNELGGLQAVAELLQVDYEMHGMTRDPLNLVCRAEMSSTSRSIRATASASLALALAATAASPPASFSASGAPRRAGGARASAWPCRKGLPRKRDSTAGLAGSAVAAAAAREGDISALHTSSDDSFSLSSGDPGQEAPREGRAQSCSPCRGPDGGRREAGSRAHPLLRLKAAHASLSNDSLNSGSTGDGPGTREHTRPCQLAALAEYREGPPCTQARPSRLDLDPPGAQPEPAAQDAAAADARVRTIKLSPTYQHVPLLEGAGRAGSGPPGAGSRKQAWLPAEALSKVPEKLGAEAAALCLSRCSSLSSLSSAGRPGPSEARDLDDSDSSLEGLEEAGPSEAALDGAWRGPGAASLPMAIPAPRRGRGLGVEDATPSSSSENCVQETPLVLSRCSSVSSLGSFESPSIASSIPSDPCSGLGSGTVSPSELPDSPGQTMPPSRSKTPPPAPAPPGERESTQFSLQWESYVKRFLDIADCRERCRLPSELDAGSVRFTVEKPDENFSCASSLSALALHEHYVQKDVELRLLPPACPERGGGGGGGPGLHFAGHRRRDEAAGRLEGPTAAEQELELLRECLGAAVPARLRKVASALVPGRRALPVPVYMLVPAPAREDDSCTDSAEGTQANFSSTASLSDETLQGPPRDAPGGRADRQKPAGRAVPARQVVGHRHRAGGAGRSLEQARGASRSRAGLELPLRRPPSTHTDGDGSHAGRARGDGTLQSLCLTTPTEEAVYCFYGDDSDEEPSRAAATLRRPSAIPRAVKRERPAGRKEAQAVPKPVPKPAPPARAQPSLIADETPPRCSLSSSASSLGEPEPPAPAASRPRAREAAVTKDPGPGGGLAGSPSPRGQAELLRRGIGSALPRRRPQAPAPRRRKPQAAQPDERPADGPQERGEEAAGSDHASDLDSVEWRAIQEGANSIVTWLHQAAAAAATGEASSESDSILSFMSGLSVGSTLQPSPHRKGPRPRAEGQASSGVRPEKQDAALAQRSSGPRSSCGPEKPRGAQKTVSGVPAVLRGRTVIYVPSPAPRAPPKAAPSPRAAPRKMGPPSPAQPAAPAKAPGLGQPRSRSLHRPGKISELVALSPPQRSATPPARLAKTPSSSSSQTSPASQPLPRRSPPATQSTGPLPGPGSSALPKTPARALLAKQHKTQKSPVRIPFMQRPARRGPPPLARAALEPGPRGRAGAEGGPGARGGRLGLVRMASARSSGSESSDRSGFRRQLTFIKESPGLPRRRRAEPATSASTSATVPASQGGSPRRGRPPLPAVFLCSSRCDELRAAPRQAPGPHRLPAAPPSPGERPPRRTSSESPSRLPVRTPAARPETVKRYASLPHISVARKPDGAAPAPTADATRRSSDGEARPLPRVAAPGTTWRRIRDEDVPHILRSTLPATALPLRGASPEEGPGGPPQRKTSDAVVQTEDFVATKTNSSTSPSLESREPPQVPAGGPISLLGSDVDGPTPAKAPTAATFIHEGLAVAAGGFPASRHGSPSRSARVPPFNYVPSPMVAAPTDSAVEKAPAATPASLLE
uniref:APC regulator of WNT signaling pathway 2 n=1 Tax=Equus asinus asinus TaxID=83772 RepID=A0A8C4N4I1_EQUAS